MRSDTQVGLALGVGVGDGLLDAARSTAVGVPVRSDTVAE